MRERGGKRARERERERERKKGRERELLKCFSFRLIIGKMCFYLKNISLSHVLLCSIIIV